MSRKYDIITEIQNLPFNIYNIFGWIKVLWNNFDWDGSFLLEILEYKIKRMKKYMMEDSYLTKGVITEDVMDMDTCIDACRNLIDKNFEHDLIDKHYEKYPISLEDFLNNPARRWSKEELKDFHMMDTKIKNLTEMYKNQLFDILKDKYDGWGD